MYGICKILCHLDTHTLSKHIYIYIYIYRAHASELGNPIPSEPFVFLKPVSSYITQGQDIKVCISLIKSNIRLDINFNVFLV